MRELDLAREFECVAIRARLALLQVSAAGQDLYGGREGGGSFALTFAVPFAVACSRNFINRSWNDHRHHM